MKEDSSLWRKATYSNGSGSCIEAGDSPGAILVRDSKEEGQSDRTTLAFTPGAWRVFLGKIR